jgi:6-pyruvoyltetrahydropterin/6-carboxytetrahydropterin synthase
MEIFRDFKIAAAHRLINLPEGHKCAQLHGHSFHIRVAIKGEVGSETGWVMDFADIKKAVKPVLLMIDHRNLNDIDGLSNPTCENIAIWLWEKLKINLPGLSQIIIRENSESGCIYNGPTPNH